MTEKRTIWTFIETLNGEIVESSLELFTPALEIAGKTGGSVEAVIFGSGIEAAAQKLGYFGADRVIAAEVGEYDPEVYTAALSELIAKYQPDALMLSATANAKDFASKLACRIRTGVTANCTQLSVDAESGVISWMMPAPGGIIATILCEKTRPQMGTVCPGIFKKPTADVSRQVSVTMEMVGESFESRVQHVAKEILKAESSIEDASIIVAGGFGVGKDGFEVLEQLADAIGGVVAASRAAVDAEWIGPDRLVGQSGKVVHPKLYIACGISGALQHVVGIDSECIVAINTDKNAPIFDIADYGIIGSYAEVVPALIEAVNNSKS